jgi:hypothetical protein
MIKDFDINVVVDKNFLRVHVRNGCDSAHSHRFASRSNSTTDWETHTVVREKMDVFAFLEIIGLTTSTVRGTLYGRKVIDDPMMHIVLLDGLVQLLVLLTLVLDGASLAIGVISEAHRFASNVFKHTDLIRRMPDALPHQDLSKIFSYFGSFLWF